MSRTSTPNVAPFSRPRRRRRARRADPFGVVSQQQTSHAMGSVAEADALFDDLLALLDAGLIVAVDQPGAVRYTVLDDNAAGFGEPVIAGSGRSVEEET